MKIVIAPNAFKDSLSAIQAADAMSLGVRRVCPGAQICQIPVADGGDGLTDIAVHILKGVELSKEVSGPSGNKINASFCYLPKKNSAVIEMAVASGLSLLPLDKRNPMLTSSKGTGELIKAVLDLNVTRIFIGIGGSATNDGGTGIADALGIKFLDKNGQKLDPVGKNLQFIQSIDTKGLDPRLNNIKIQVLCDVTNPLLGKNGAARIYAPQKGATPIQVDELEKGLSNLADKIETCLQTDVRKIPGAGAAGGAGAGLLAFFNAELTPGIDVILDLVELDRALKNADLVITGEGKLDEQTISGKAPAGVAKRAKALNIPCFAIAGAITNNLTQLHDSGITAIFSLCPGPVTLENAVKNASKYLTETTEQVIRAYLANQ